MAPRGLMEYKNEAWLLHPVPEIAAALTAGFPARGGAPPFVPVRQGCVLFLLPQGLLQFSEEDPEAPRIRTLRQAAQTRIGPFTGLAVSPEGAGWITGRHGLARPPGPVRNLDAQTPWQEFLPPESLQLVNLSQPEPGPEGGVVLLAESTAHPGKWVVTFDGRNWVARPAGSNNFFHAWGGPDQVLWAVTPEALFQWVAVQTNWVEYPDLSPGQINDVALESGGAFWLATANGLFRGARPLWGKPAPLQGLNQPVPCLMLDEAGSLFFIAADQLHWLQDDTLRSFPLPAATPASSATPALFPLKNGALLLALGDDLFEFHPAPGSFTPLRRLVPNGPVKLLGCLPDGGVCLHWEGETNVEIFDGTEFQPLANPPPLRDEAVGPATLFAADNADLWIGCGQSVWRRHNNLWQRFASKAFSAPASSVGFAGLPDGKICCATPDQLWEFDGENWLLLKSRFNHINALTQSRDGGIWLASNGGLFRFAGGAWMDYGAAEGLPNGAIFAIGGNQRGQMWAATTRGVTRFQPGADPDPPRTRVRRLAEEDHGLTEKDTLNLLFDGGDKWKYTPRERLLYSYQLDQQGWSAFRETTAFFFPNPAPGRHFFQVRAMDRNGNVGPQPATLESSVITPWFRETRLWIILSLGLAVAVFFAVVAWQRHRQLIRSYAAVEQKVAERTRELEVATRELLHRQKMNALGTLAAGIAHDFNNILSIIKGSAQIIGDHPDQPDKIRTRVERIQTVVQQGAEIVDAMLGFSRSSETPAIQCDLNAVVADTLKLLGDRFLRETDITFERAENLPQLAVSREFIRQILINFIFNAAEAATGRKPITLTTRPADHLPPDLFLSPVPAASAFVLISVRDHGAGIAPEIKARIFEPFFTTKALSTRRGTGLGLSMVYELAKKWAPAWPSSPSSVKAVCSPSYFRCPPAAGPNPNPNPR